MAMAVEQQYLWGVVDMGSNGIRCSITNLSPVTARILPALYSDRIPISLYDAQYSSGQKQPIPQDTIEQVITALHRFKNICQDYGVPDTQCRIIATEATRVAENSSAYCSAIKEAIGWEVTMLAKEDEGRTGAYGVTSSFESISGLMMDLGGGSTQITWVTAKSGEMTMSDAGSVSMPYGAAALIRRLEEANQKGGKKLSDLKSEIISNLQDAVKKISIPSSMLDPVANPHGLNLYLCGGGFRGWGYLLMSQHRIRPYPISTINGFKVDCNDFLNIQMVSETATENEDIFRVSKRRASQVPAVALLISCLKETLPAIQAVHFAQGGVREGFLYDQLPRELRAEHPLYTVTKEYASKSARTFAQILFTSAPAGINLLRDREWVHVQLLRALSQAMFIHAAMNKDIAAASALRSTTTGALAAVQGVDHEERALLGIMLCQRWGGVGALSPVDLQFHKTLLAICPHEAVWWALFFGQIAAIIAVVYPVGIVPENHQMSIHSTWNAPQYEHDNARRHTLHVLKHPSRQDDFDNHDEHNHHIKHEHGKKNGSKECKSKKHKGGNTRSDDTVVVAITADKETIATENFLKVIKGLEKLGKPKHWPEKSVGFSVKVRLTGSEE